MEQKNNINHDANWKFIIEKQFSDFMQFFLPDLALKMDYSCPPEFMEQELHKIVSDKIKKGKIINDKLVKIRLLDGEEKWVLIHIEVQGNHERDFAERMFTYFYRIYDRYSKKITAIAIYSGNRIPRKKDKFAYDFYGTSLEYKFNTYVAKDADEENLLKIKNPFSLVVLAVKYLHKIPEDKNETYLFKIRLIRLCKEQGFNREQISNLFRFIDLTVQTPKEFERKFAEEAIDILVKDQDMEIKGFISESYVGHLYRALHGESIEEKFQKLEREREMEREKLEREREMEREKLEREREMEREKLEREREMEREKLEREREKLELEREIAVKNLLQKLNLSVESVAEMLNLSVEKVLEIKERIK